MIWNCPDLDPFNRDRKRNLRNTVKSTYNCGGYALECFSWYLPRLKYSGHYSFGTHSKNHRSTMYSVKCMLKEFPDLRIIHSLDEIQEDEYPILFRHSSDGDFHYIKRCNDGVWRHKMGGTYPIRVMPKSQLWSIWCHRYNGEIVMLAKKKY